MKARELCANLKGLFTGDVIKRLGLLEPNFFFKHHQNYYQKQNIT